MNTYQKKNKDSKHVLRTQASDNYNLIKRNSYYIKDNRPHPVSQRKQLDHVSKTEQKKATVPSASIIQRVKFSDTNPFWWATIRNMDVNSLKMDTILCLDNAFPNVMALDNEETMERHVNFWRGPAKFVQMTYDEIILVHTIANNYNQFLDRKAAENNTILSFPNNLKSRYDRLSQKKVRKVNRISGLIKKKGLTTFSNQITTALDDYVIWGTNPNVVLQTVLEHNRFPDYSFKRLEFLKFLLAAVRNIPGLNAAHYEHIITSLEQTIEEQHPQKVIAHRGDGATFDKMGGVLPRGDHDHIYSHEHENSEASTRKAMQSWLSILSSLSGIECDVFLTQDNLPIVTHTQNLSALLAQENRNPLFTNENSNIRNMLAIVINPRFMRLNNWLNLIETYVQQKENQLQQINLSLNKKLRIEIEMKQSDVMTSVFSADNWKYVEKVVSEFMKNSRFSHLMEIAMFNNSDVPVLRFRRARDKTMLSHITYAKGGVPEAELPEVRFGMHQKGIANLIHNGTLDHKIVTFAPGLDHPGGFAYNKQLLPVHGLTNKLNVTIEQSIQSARHKHLIALMKTRKEQGNHLGPTSIHTLTDHGNQGGWNILDRGLPVGTPDQVLDGWTTDEVRHKHPELTDQQIRDAVADARRQNDPSLIGKILIERVPALL